MEPSDCEHIRVETLYQYDAQKNRTVFWACPECRMLFQPKGLADADLVAENEALREYALGLMANSYHGMSKNERKLILESELIALLTEEQGQVLDRS